ncbi:tetratricopeptide repeat protein [Streptomyces sp. NBC_01477]|uniref:tetratricopeptide repeat protein n=1 Tax=Streptomyces sp. NBC_01477 TaxID=2976015 RepID=UPI002E374A42|nr:tetratricopeptide repeat protein [Streptomyces sp. NBC_01477]
MTAHEWRIGTAPAAEPQGDFTVDCHRGLRGPYTGLGSLLRRVVPLAVELRPGITDRHVTEILSVAPELRPVIGVGPETLTSLAAPEERTRIYPANRTRRLAHGAVELLAEYAAAAGAAPLRLVFDRADRADHTDQEFLAIFLRRARPDRIRITVTSGGGDLIDELTAALDRYAQRSADRPSDAGKAAGTDQAADTETADGRTPEELLHAFIAADGTSDDPAEAAAYERADPALRKTLHDRRAAELLALDEMTLGLGAIPYHLERGGDPAGAGADALYEAARHCGAMGYYHSVIDVATRGRDLTDPETKMERFWHLSTRASSAMVVLEQTVEAEPTYIDLRARYDLPELQLSTGYALAMLYTRFHPAELKDHHLARAYINNSIAIASLLPDPEQRAFHSVFQRNGLALIEMRTGRIAEALRLVTDGIDYLDRELPGEKHRLHRSVLVHNRGKVYLGMGRLDEALADLSKVIELDPNYADYYFDRADARRRLGDLDGATADCDTAISLSPPFYELHYNRGDIKAEAGDVAGAVADFAYVVELEPDQLDARVNLIGLLMESGEAAAAGPYVEEGLILHPGDARLLHLRGELALEGGDTAAARQDFDAALAADPGLVPALASRAVLAHAAGDHVTAITDLSAAVKADPENPDLLYNRGFVYEAAGLWADAVEDYTRALALADEDDRDELLSRRAVARSALLGLTGAQ